MRMIPIALVILCFCVLGAGRLNRMHMFDPDSPYYVMMARSLAELRGYCRTDDVQHLPFSFRPPGMSVLLAPLAFVFPFEALTAKFVVLASAACLLWLIYLTAEDRHRNHDDTRPDDSHRCDWSAIGVVLLVASSPYTLLLGTEVLSEVPFAALTLLLMRLLTREAPFASNVLGRAAGDSRPDTPWRERFVSRGDTSTLGQSSPATGLRIGAAITVVADTASVGSDAGSIRHDATVIVAPILITTAPSGRQVGLVSLLLAFLPFVRTVGVVFVAAVAVWSLVRRARWIWIVPVVCAVAATAAWSYRNSFVSQTTYSTVVAASVSSNGIVPLLVRALLRATTYFGLIGELLLPGLQPGLPRYESVMIDGTVIPPVPKSLVSLLTLAIVGLSLAGMSARRARDGALAGLYLIAYLAALAVYPWTHERLAWPLIPMLWAFVPAGCRALSSRESIAAFLPAARVRPLLWLFALVLAGWQTHHSVRMVQANVALLQSGDQFYEDSSPGYYYCDWNAAGTWLAANSPADSHVLTVHADVGSTSQRPQEMYAFDAGALPLLHRTITEQSVDYLVVPSRRLSCGFPWGLVGTDKAFLYEVVYEHRHVAILSVRPRAESDPAPSPRYPDHVTEGLTRVEVALRRTPHRVDLQIERAFLLDEQGDLTNSLLILRSLVNRRIASPGLYAALGDALVRTHRGAEALPWLNRAVWLPEADTVIQQIGESIRNAKAQRKTPRDSEKS